MTLPRDKVSHCTRSRPFLVDWLVRVIENLFESAPSKNYSYRKTQPVLIFLHGYWWLKSHSQSLHSTWSYSLRHISSLTFGFVEISVTILTCYYNSIGKVNLIIYYNTGQSSQLCLEEHSKIQAHLRKEYQL